MDDATYCQQALVKLRTAVDQHFDRARDRQPDALMCQAGCSACCKPHLSVFGLEADRVATALASLRKNAPELRQIVRDQGLRALQDPHSARACALLVEDRCTIYEERPLLCRSHGLAVVEDNASAPQNCELNYRDQAPDPQSVLALPALNMPLGVSAQIWQKARGGALRVSLASLAAAPDDDAARPEDPRP